MGLRRVSGAMTGTAVPASRSSSSGVSRARWRSSPVAGPASDVRRRWPSPASAPRSWWRAARPSALEEVAGEINKRGGRCLAVPTNIRELDQVDALCAAVYDEFGRMDYLINNAGGQFPALPTTISDNGWRAVVDLNLNGTWNMTNRFMVPMAEAGFGLDRQRGAHLLVRAWRPHVRSFGCGPGRRGEHGQDPGALSHAARRHHQRLRPGGVRHTGDGRAPSWRPTGRSEPRASPTSSSPRARRCAWAQRTRWRPWCCSCAPRPPATSAGPPSSPTAPRCRRTG